jgi:TetR/AcrR family transcriptional regulator of autoinduction and epiphytic fitness
MPAAAADRLHRFGEGDVMNSVLELSVTDGRWLRSIRTRAAIIEAWLALIAEGDLSPTAKGVADRARIGLRTVFQHFSDMNALHRAAGEELLSRILPTVVPVPVDLPLADRIALVAERYGDAFEAVTGLRRACERQEWLADEIRDLIDDWEQFFRTSTSRTFAAEIEAAADTQRDGVGAAVETTLSWSVWNQLRQRRGLTPDDSRAVLVHMLHTLLGDPR